MSTQIPDHEKTWFTQANVPLPQSFNNISSSTDVFSGLIYNLKTLLCGTNTTGTSSTSTGTRTSASLWTVAASCDGVNYTGSVDRWGTTYDKTKYISNSYTAAHSWIVLENSNLGYQMLIDLNGGIGSLRISFSPTSSPFAAFSTASPPAPTEAWHIGSAGNLNNTTFLIFSDCANYNQDHYMHFTVSSEGEFAVLTNRLGIGYFNSFFAFVSCSDTHASDTRKFLTMVDNVASLPGPPRGTTSGLFGGAGQVMRRVTGGALASNGGFMHCGIAGGYAMETVGPNYATNKIDLFPLKYYCASTPMYGGYVPDFYFSTKGNVAKSLKINSVKKYILSNCLLMPFVDISPKL